MSFSNIAFYKTNPKKYITKTVGVVKLTLYGPKKMNRQMFVVRVSSLPEAIFIYKPP